MIAITETWLSNNILNGEILPNYYTLYRRDRASRGGGVLLAVRDHLSSKQLQSSDDIESIVVEIHSSRSFIVCVLYIPPSADDSYHTQVSEVFSSLPLNLDVLILGDFNFPDIDWDTLGGESKHSTNFCELISDLNLCQLIASSTHKAGNILDLILTNNDQLVYDIITNPVLPTGLSSDHFVITFTISVPQCYQEHSSHGSFFNYSKANWEEMNFYFSQYNFNELTEILDIDSAWACFKNIISEAVLQFVPKICPRKHPRPKWFNSEIQHHLNKVHTLRRRCRSKPSTNLLSQLSLAEAELSEQMSTAKHDFEFQLVRDLAVSNSNRIYKYISSLSSSHQLPPIMHFDEKQASSSFEQAQLFNQFFHSVFTHSTCDLPSSDDLPISAETLSNINISAADVCHALHNLDPNKASGIDSINPALLKHCAVSLTTPIHHLLTLSL